MCKALTLQLRRCRHNPREGDYCGMHNMDIPADGHDHNAHNLAEICRRARDQYFDENMVLRSVYRTNLTNEAVRRYVYEDLMPFLRDCWKMGISTANFPEETLRTHYAVIGQAGQVDLPGRIWTADQRRAQNARIRQEHQMAARQRLQELQNVRRANAVPQFQDPVFAFPNAPPFGGVLHRQNAGGLMPAAAAHALLNIPAPPVNLPSVAVDSQSVHRTSVNESVMASIEVLKQIAWDPKKWPILHESGKLPGGRKLFEHIYLWSNIFTREESKEMFTKVFPLLEKNYISGIMNIEEEVFGIRPWVVIYKICQWTWERPVDEQKEIFKRMLEECYEGREMCIQGKVSRFVNILCGFHPDIKVGLSGKEMLQDRMARLAQAEGMESEARMEEGRGILRDGGIPEDQWEAWLEPLLLF